MRFKTLTLKNFCQFHDRVLEFDPGLNMFIGPCGAGKTNVLRAMQLVLTGDAGGNRKKAQDIYQGILTDQQSYVEAALEHSDTDMLIRRSLRPATNCLTIDEMSWRAVGEINSELFRRLATTKDQLSNYVFVHQRKIDQMFEQQGAERAASLAELFGAAHAKKVFREAGNFISAIEVPTTTLDEDAILAQLNECHEEADAVSAEIRDLNMPENPDSQMTELQSTIECYSRYQDQVNRLQKLHDEIGQKQMRIADFAAPMHELGETLAALKAALDGAEVDYVKAQQGLEHWRAYRNAAMARAAIAHDRAEFDEKWKDLEMPAPPTVEKPSDKCIAGMEKLEQERQETQDSIDALQRQAKTCRTCGQDLPDRVDVDKRVHELAKHVAWLNEKIRPILRPLTIHRDYEAACTLADEKFREKHIDEISLKAREAALRPFDKPDQDEEHHMSIVSERNETLAIYEKMLAQQQEQSKQLAVIKGELNLLQKEQTETQLIVSSTRVPSLQEYQRLIDERTALNDKMKQYAELSQRRVNNNARRNALSEQWEDVQKVKEQGGKTREARDHLEKVRSVFHVNEAPRILSYTYIESMLKDVNDNLELFEAPFAVEMTDELGFIANFHDGIRKQPDRALSVGERIVLSLAFRITVNSTFAKEVGMLIMDEPTAGLDETYLNALPKALERLRDLSHDRGLQVLFVTHEPRISHLFDKTIELAAA